uniref:Uncharacterized protein n=1 Tax=Moniliophthora roreri TaxID=221103 RepID=A0A0W0FYH4_MONRR
MQEILNKTVCALSKEIGTITKREMLSQDGMDTAICS